MLLFLAKITFEERNPELPNSMPQSNDQLLRSGQLRPNVPKAADLVVLDSVQVEVMAMVVGASTRQCAIDLHQTS